MAIILTECETKTVALILYTQSNPNLQPRQNCNINVKISGYPQYDNTNQQLSKYIDVSLITSSNFNPYLKTDQWRPQTQAWILSNRHETRNGMTQSVKYWNDKQLLEIVQNKKLIDWCVDVIVQDRDGLSYTINIQEIILKPLIDVPEVVTPSAPIVEECDPKLYAVGELLKYVCRQLEIGAVCWSHLNKLSVIDYSMNSANDTIQTCFANMKEDLRRDMITPSLPQTKLLHDKLENWLTHLTDFETSIAKGAILTNKVPKAISELRDSSRVMVQDAIDGIMKYDLALAPSDSRDIGFIMNINSNVENLSKIMDIIKVSVDEIEDGMATQMDAGTIRKGVSEILDHVSKGFNQLSGIEDKIGEVATTLLDAYNDYYDKHIHSLKSYDSETAKIVSEAFKAIHTNTTENRVVLNQIDANVHMLLGKDISSTVPTKPTILNTPTHGLKYVNDDLDPPSYNTAITTMRFLNTNKNSLAGTTGPLPFSPSGDSLVSSYFSVAGCTINMCMGPLLTYGDYLVTDGNTMLSHLIPYCEVDLFEDVRLRIWYNASNQTDFPSAVKTAVFYGSFAEPPLLLSN